MMAGNKQGSLPLDIFTKKTDLKNVGVVVNIPPNSSASEVQSIINSTFNVPASATYFHGKCKEVALVVFKQPVNNVQNAGNVPVNIVPVSSPKGLVVDLSDCDDPMKTLSYFDTEESVIQSDVTSVDIYPDIAIIKLPEPEIALPVVLSKIHQFHGKTLHLQPYYSEFYDAVVKTYPSQPKRFPEVEPDRKDRPKPTVCWFPKCSSSQCSSQTENTDKNDKKDDNSDEVDDIPQPAVCWFDECSTLPENS